MTVPLGHYLMLSALLFGVGLCGALARKNAIVILIGIEIMLNSAMLNFVVFWRYEGGLALSPLLFAMFAIGVAAAESAVGLALIIAIYRHYRTVDPDEFRSLQG